MKTRRAVWGVVLSTEGARDWDRHWTKKSCRAWIFSPLTQWIENLCQQNQQWLLERQTKTFLKERNLNQFWKWKYDIHNYVFICVLSPGTMNQCFVTLICNFFFFYRGSGSSFIQSAMLLCQSSTVAQNGQTKHWSQRVPFGFLSSHCWERLDSGYSVGCQLQPHYQVPLNPTHCTVKLQNGRDSLPVKMLFSTSGHVRVPHHAHKITFTYHRKKIRSCGSILRHFAEIFCNVFNQWWVGCHVWE